MKPANADHAVGDTPDNRLPARPYKSRTPGKKTMSNDRFQDWIARIAGAVVAWLILTAIAFAVIGFVAADDGPASPPSAWNGR